MVNLFIIDEKCSLFYDYSDINSKNLNNLIIDQFADGEFCPNITTSIRGNKVFLLCSTNSSDNIIKLNLTIDACRRASAKEIIAVIPYFGYARQDRKDRLRGSIGAKVMANMLVSNGCNRIITIDLHASQIQGFFNIPVDHIDGNHIFIDYISEIITTNNLNPILCSPDAGGMKRVEEYVKRIHVPVSSIYKYRNKPNEIATMMLLGNVENKDVIIIDDIVDTAGTLCKASDLLIENGAKSVYAVCTHPILSGNAIDNINKSSLTQLIVSNTIMSDDKISNCPKIKVISCKQILDKVMNIVYNNFSFQENISTK